MPSLLSAAEHSHLILVDLQSRLLAAMPEPERSAMLKATKLLARAAGLLEIPVTATEQYPKGLGATDPEVLEVLPGASRRFGKTAFSCCEAEGLRPSLEVTGRRQVVMAGVEAHVCVLQSALDLTALGFRVFVVEDAVCSREPAHKRNALERLRQSGVIISNAESVVFEWLTDAAHPQFKTLAAMIR
jgi:nicotinamidase-related amidase